MRKASKESTAATSSRWAYYHSNSNRAKAGRPWAFRETRVYEVKGISENQRAENTVDGERQSERLSKQASKSLPGWIMMSRWNTIGTAECFRTFSGNSHHDRNSDRRTANLPCSRPPPMSAVFLVTHLSCVTVKKLL